MTIDLNCPAEVWRCRLPRTPEEPCEITLFNLGAKPIVSVEILLIFLDAEGKELHRLVDRRHEVDGEVAQSFAALLRIPPEMLTPRPDHVEVSVEKAWLGDGMVWRKNRANLISYTSNALKRGRSLNTLRYIAGDDAIGYPQLQDSCWLCVCGRPNALDTDACVRCGRVRADVFTHFNQAAVEKAVKGGDSAALQQILRGVLGTAEGQRLAESIRKMMDK